MSPKIVLNILVLAGVLIGFVSGMVSLLTRTDEERKGSNRKKLTSFGKLALGIAILGVVISICSESLRIVVDAVETRDKANREAEDNLWKNRSEDLSKKIKKDTEDTLQKEVQTQLKILDARERVLADNVKKTNSLVDAIWAESHQVTPGDIRVQIRYTIDDDLIQVLSIPDHICELNCKLSVRARVGLTPVTFNRRRWSSAQFINVMNASLLLDANTPTTSKYFDMVTGSSLTLIDDFANFSGKVGPFLSALYWNNADVEIHLAGFSPKFAKAVVNQLQKEPDLQKSAIEDFAKRYDIEEIKGQVLGHEGTTIYPLPIAAKATLYIHGPPITDVIATVVVIDSSDAELRDRIVLKFPVITLKDDTFVAPSSAGEIPELRTYPR